MVAESRTGHHGTATCLPVAPRFDQPPQIRRNFGATLIVSSRFPRWGHERVPVARRAWVSASGAGAHGWRPRLIRRPDGSGISKRVSRHSSQEVCPWNRFAPPTDEAALVAREGLDGASLIEWMGMTQEEFSRRFRNSPVKRTKRRGLLRNVAVALGNWGSAEAVPALAAALSDEEPLVRGHAAWALGRIATEHARQALAMRREEEEDAWVREEISAALENWFGQTARVQ
jgi:hypothetical protein